MRSATEVLLLRDKTIHESPAPTLRRGGYRVTDIYDELEALQLLRDAEDLVLVTDLTVFPTNRILRGLADAERSLLGRLVSITPCADAFRKLAPGCLIVDRDHVETDLITAVDRRFAEFASRKHGVQFGRG